MNSLMVSDGHCLMQTIYFQAIGECSLSMAGALYLMIITASSSILFAAPVGLLLKSAGRVKCIIFAIICDIIILSLILALKKWHISVYIMTCLLRGLSDATYHTVFSGMACVYKMIHHFKYHVGESIPFYHFIRVSAITYNREDMYYFTW